MLKKNGRNGLLKKRILSTSITLIMIALLSACGTKDKEDAMTESNKTDNTITEENKTDNAVVDNNIADNNVTDNNVADNSSAGVSSGISDEDKSYFASGIKTGESDDTNSTEEEKNAETASPTEAQEPANDADAEEKTDEFVLNNEIEERCPATYTTRRADVKYGEYSHGTYYSETCGMDRGYSILLPADYTEDKQYPVLYLLHGIFGNEFSFSSDPSNKIKEIVGNMTADGIIGETIVVCPNMYAATDPAQKPAFDTESCLPYDNFINDLINDLMPYIEKEYSVLTGRENTYLAGFSMGGRETIFITLQRPELFGYVCAISAAPGIVPTTDKFMTHQGQMQENEMKFADDAVEPNAFIICCGTRDSVVGTYPKSYHELLDTNGSAHIWYEINGADHDNKAIQSGLYNLFKQIGYDRANRESN